MAVVSAPGNGLNKANGDSENSLITAKTSVKLSLATFFAVTVFAAGFYPWLLSQVRSVVREEMQTTVAVMDRDWERRWNEDGRRRDNQIFELRQAIRDLRVIVERRR
jgi:hypothetical protein